MSSDDDKLSFTEQLRKEGFIKNISEKELSSSDDENRFDWINDKKEVDVELTPNNLYDNSLYPEYNILPLLIIPNTILLPHTSMSVTISKLHTEHLLKTMDLNNHCVLLIPKKLPSENQSETEFYEIGTILEVKSLEEGLEDYTVDVKIKDKIRVKDIKNSDGQDFVIFDIIEEENNLTSEESKEINKIINDSITSISNLIPNSEKYVQKIIETVDVPNKIAEIFPYLRIPIDKKQELLELDSIKIRALKVVELLIEQRDSMFIQMELAKKMNDNLSETHKQNLLREQMKLIQEELNMTDGDSQKTYRDRIKEADLPEEVEKVALEELNKLERQGPNNSEENIIRNYLDTILQLPWHKAKKEEIDINFAKEQLDKDHYGLDKVKKRIIQHLSVLKMKDDKQGSILLFVGPPGTGKTSLGKSIATALSRPYIRISLGGVKDESEIRGHRRTYLGALPGRIINGMKKAGQKNPVFVLDEIDKLTASINGNPTSALLEVLDPEQNDTFSDHYLEVPYDLSDVFFIGTANSLQDIPGPLRDRLEIIELDSYTNDEKEHIAKEHLIDEVLEEHGLTHDDIIIKDNVITTLIEKYTREAGVRGLKRELATISRYVTERIVVDNVEKPYVVDSSMLYDILGHEKAYTKLVNDYNPPGVVTGLSWTPIGGDILYIESILLPGKGKLKITGKIGDVMQESAEIALSLIKSRFALILKDTDFKNKDIHIHVPEGAIPKDGPSAGVTLLTAIASLVLSKAVNPKLAMTGEISLSGKVLPVGGIKEKIIAAHKSKIEKILLPRKNMKDLDEIPENVRNEIEYVAMDTVEDVLKEALDITLPKAEELNIPASTVDLLNQ